MIIIIIIVFIFLLNHNLIKKNVQTKTFPNNNMQT